MRLAPHAPDPRWAAWPTQVRTAETAAGHHNHQPLCTRSNSRSMLPEHASPAVKQARPSRSRMNRDVTTRLLFVALLFVVVWSAIQVIAPFLGGFTWAAVLVVTFRPSHRRLARALHGKTWAATTILTLLVAAFVVVPISVAAVQAAKGGVAAFDWIQQQYQSADSSAGPPMLPPWLAGTLDNGKRLVGLDHVDLRAAAISGLQRVAQFLAVQAPVILGSTLGLVFSFLVMIAGMPILFSRGETLVEALASALPLPLEDARRILGDIGDMTRSVFVSVGLTAAVQAALAWAAFFALGVPRPVSLTAVMFFAAILPGGVVLVWAPVALWLAAAGHTGSALLMAGWGAGVVGTIDNVLRPLLAGRGVKIEGTTLFLGMIGGLIAFGLVGLFLGPILLFATTELVAILRRDIYADRPASV